MLVAELKIRPFSAYTVLLQLHNRMSSRLGPFLRLPKFGMPKMLPGLAPVYGRGMDGFSVQDYLALTVDIGPMSTLSA